ncbi:MAG TPA: IS66 family transposase [Pseudolabrys sp.]|nr:IS66 family transposase [Pseudolabrys sp.]
MLKQMLVDVTVQLEKTQKLLRQLLAARTGVRSEQLSADQLRLFAQELGVDAAGVSEADRDDDDSDSDPPASVNEHAGAGKPRGRRPLPSHLKRERVVHDLSEADKHCGDCHQELRHIGEEVSERYEYIAAQLLVVEDACQKYACSCTVKTATKPPRPIEKSTAGASLLAHVIVSKVADHLPVHRQAKMLRRFGVEIADQTMCGWMRQSAELLAPLYQQLKHFVLASKVVGTDDTPVKVLDRMLPHTRRGRFWPYVGDRGHPAVVYDYTPTRERAGPEQFLKPYRGYLQADAYAAYDSFFIDPARGLVEVGCWAHARRHAYNARENEPTRMGAVLAYVAQLYALEKRARRCGIHGEALRLLREQTSRPVLEQLHTYLLKIKDELLPKSEAGQAVAYMLKNWAALTRYLDDGDLPIDNNHTERSLRGVAVGRNNWTFLGSDRGGRTMAVLRSFVASCELVKVDPFDWFRDVLSRIATHSIQQLDELLPHRWAPSHP